jgi:hypothetical protein
MQVKDSLFALCKVLLLHAGLDVLAAKKLQDSQGKYKPISIFVTLVHYPGSE